MFIWPDDNAPDGATWTGSFNQAQWDEYLQKRKNRKAKGDVAEIADNKAVSAQPAPNGDAEAADDKAASAKPAAKKATAAKGDSK